jgi:hypothetical protein
LFKNGAYDMIPKRTNMRLAAWSLGLLACWPAYYAAANDDGCQFDARLGRQTYPRRKADLENWIKKQMVPGRDTKEDIVAIFGLKYRHGFRADGNRGRQRDMSSIIYNLAELGIADGGKEDWLLIELDVHSGRLLHAELGPFERQTGFHLEQQSGQ